MDSCDVGVFEVECFVEPFSFEVSFWWGWLAVEYLDVEVCEASPVMCDEVGVDVFHGL